MESYLAVVRQNYIEFTYGAEDMTPRLISVIILFFAKTTSAHEGPPFPLFVDQKVDRYVVSVWTDPDVGTGQFFVILNTPDLPPDLRVQIGVQPVSGRLPETFYTAQRENLQNQVQYRADVQFDAEELWRCAHTAGECAGKCRNCRDCRSHSAGLRPLGSLVVLSAFSRRRSTLGSSDDPED